MLTDRCFTESTNRQTSLYETSEETDRADRNKDGAEQEKATGHEARAGDQTDDTEKTGPGNPETRERSRRLFQFTL